MEFYSPAIVGFGNLIDVKTATQLLFTALKPRRLLAHVAQSRPRQTVLQVLALDHTCPQPSRHPHVISLLTISSPIRVRSGQPIHMVLVSTPGAIMSIVERDSPRHIISTSFPQKRAHGRAIQDPGRSWIGRTRTPLVPWYGQSPIQ